MEPSETAHTTGGKEDDLDRLCRFRDCTNFFQEQGSSWRHSLQVVLKERYDAFFRNKADVRIGVMETLAGPVLCVPPFNPKIPVLPFEHQPTDEDRQFCCSCTVSQFLDPAFSKTAAFSLKKLQRFLEEELGFSREKCEKFISNPYSLTFVSLSGVAGSDDSKEDMFLLLACLTDLVRSLRQVGSWGQFIQALRQLTPTRLPPRSLNWIDSTLATLAPNETSLDEVLSNQKYLARKKLEAAFDFTALRFPEDMALRDALASLNQNLCEEPSFRAVFSLLNKYHLRAVGSPPNPKLSVHFPQNMPPDKFVYNICKLLRGAFDNPDASDTVDTPISSLQLSFGILLLLNLIKPQFSGPKDELDPTASTTTMFQEVDNGLYSNPFMSLSAAASRSVESAVYACAVLILYMFFQKLPPFYPLADVLTKWLLATTSAKDQLGKYYDNVAHIVEQYISEGNAIVFNPPSEVRIHKPMDPYIRRIMETELVPPGERLPRWHYHFFSEELLRITLDVPWL